MLELVQRCRAALAALDPALLSTGDATALVPELARLEKACASAKARAAGRAALSAAQLAQTSGSSVGAAKAATETAGALGSCPDTAEALAKGDVSLDQAGEIAKTEKERPGSERELLNLAKNTDLKTLKERSRKLRHGAIGVDELPPELGVPFVNQLETETDRPSARHRQETRRPTGGT